MHSGKARRRPPSGKSAGRAAVVDDGGGFFASLVDRTFENPAMSGGVVVMALTAAAIVSNAMFLQKIRHPDPLFATRSASIEQAAPVPVPLPRARAEHLPKADPTPEVRALVKEPDAVPLPAPQPATRPQPDIRLMKDIQKALADAGLYGGAVDGKMGAMTRAAIEKFQRRAGLEPTGSPSEALLAGLRAPPKPVPAPEPVVEAAKPAPPKPVAAGPSPEVIAEQSRYRKVQMALNDIGYGPVSVDGHPGAETADAIRRFELDNGLPLTGSPTDRVIARLVKIGALPQR